MILFFHIDIMKGEMKDYLSYYNKPGVAYSLEEFLMYVCMYALSPSKAVLEECSRLLIVQVHCFLFWSS